VEAVATDRHHATTEVAWASSIARAAIVRDHWPESFSAVMQLADAHFIDLCLTPRPSGASGRFADHWARHRYEQFGKVFMIPAGLAITTRSSAGQQRSLRVWFDPQGVSEWLEDEQDWSDLRLSATLDIRSPRVRNIVARLASELQSPGLAGEMMADLLTRELAIECARFFREMPERLHGGLAPWRLRLIDERNAEEGAAPTLDELAKLVGLSVRQLTRAFRVSRGCSIGSHIEQQRIAVACSHLEMGGSIKQVASRLGFASPSGFAQAFRSARGETPRSYRARTRSQTRRLMA